AHLDTHCIIGYRYRPEDPIRVRVDARVKVRNLSREIFEVILTSVKIQSDEPKSTVVDFAILSYIYALHEPHVSIEQQCLRRAVRISGCAGTLHLRDTNEPIKVIDHCRHDARTENRDVEQCAPHSQASRNRVWCGVRGAAPESGAGMNHG